MAKPEDTLTLETTKGKVVIEMRPDLAPGHVARIKELVKDGFYDGIVFHRVIDGFMAQTGCPHGTGTGGSGKKLKAEFNKEPHVRGIVSMARASNPDSGDSQFFICFDDARFLDNQYTVWGKVIEGMETVDKIKRGEPAGFRAAARREVGDCWRRAAAYSAHPRGSGGPERRGKSRSRWLLGPRFRGDERRGFRRPSYPRSAGAAARGRLPGGQRQQGDCRAPAWAAHRARKRRARDRGHPAQAHRRLALAGLREARQEA